MQMVAMNSFIGQCGNVFYWFRKTAQNEKTIIRHYVTLISAKHYRAIEL